jgi:hypothetical protein
MKMNRRQRGAIALRLALGILVLGVGGRPALAEAPAPGTPAEIVATYSSLADGILALKRTEENLCRSILATANAHAHAARRRPSRPAT